MSEKNLSVLVIAESTGQSTHLQISYHMVAASLILCLFGQWWFFYIVREMINNSATAELMDENLLLRSQVQDLDIDLMNCKDRLNFSRCMRHKQRCRTLDHGNWICIIQMGSRRPSRFCTRWSWQTRSTDAISYDFATCRGCIFRETSIFLASRKDTM